LGHVEVFQTTPYAPQHQARSYISIRSSIDTPSDIVSIVGSKICRYFITLSMWDLSGSTTFAQARLCYLNSITKLDRWNGFKSFAGYAWHGLHEHATGTRAGKSISYGTNFITSFNKVPSVASSWLGWRYSVYSRFRAGGWVKNFSGSVDKSR
jgi:hypothetical protein